MFSDPKTMLLEAIRFQNFNLLNQFKKTISISMLQSTMDFETIPPALFINEAVQTRNAAIVQLVLSMGFKIAACDQDQRTPIMLAAKLGLNDILRVLLESWNKPSWLSQPFEEENYLTRSINMQDKDGNTALTLATDCDTITTLLLANANLNHQNHAGNTALMIFALQGNYEAVALLLKCNNIDVNITNQNDETALFLALKAHHKNIARLIFRHSYSHSEDQNKVISYLVTREEKIADQDRAGNNALMLYAKKSNHQAVKFLLKLQIYNINTQNTDGDTALLLATKEGALATIQAMFQATSNTEKPDINHENKAGYTALMLALINRNTKIRNYLIEQNALLTLQNRQGNNALMVLASHGKSDAVQYLLNYKCFDINTFNHNGNTALFLAIQAGSLETVQALFTELPHLDTPNLNHQNKAGYTALMLALLYNTDHKILHYLIDEQHADITFSNHEGNNALMIFASQGNSQIVQFLLDLKCFDLEHQNDDGDTALLLAAKAGSLQTIQALCTKLPEYKPNIDHQNNAGYTALMLINDLEICRYLIEKQNADTTLTDKQGNNVLMLLASRGQSDAVEYLLTLQSFDINMKNLQGDTALNLALKSSSQKTATHLLPQTAMSPEHREIIKNLVKRREGIATQDSQGNNPLIVFASQGNANAVSLLLSLRIFNVNTANCLGNTALFFAIKSGSFATVHALCAETPHTTDKINIDHQNKTGYTALMLALLYNSDHKIPKYLIDEQHADITYSNHEGNNALMILADQGKYDAVEYLLNLKCCDIHAKNQQGHTALILALKATCQKTARLLFNFMQENTLSSEHDTQHNQLIQYLLDRKEGIRTQDAEGYNPLMIFAKKGDFDAVSFLLSLKIFYINAENKDRDTALTLALRCGSQRTAKILLEYAKSTQSLMPQSKGFQYLVNRKAGITDTNDEGNNLLMIVASKGNASYVSFLVNLKIFDINAVNHRAETALILALRSNSQKTACILLPHTAMSPEHRKIIETLLELQEGISQTDNKGNNLLMLFAKQGNADAVSFLLSLNLFNIESQNHDGDTALFLAIKAVSLLTVQALLTAKPNINHTNIEGHSALTLAFMCKKDPLIFDELIAIPQANMTLKNKQGNNALMLFAKQHDSEIVKLLLNRFCFDVDEQNHSGDTALLLAAKAGSLETIQALFEDIRNTQKPNINHQNNAGDTALMLAKNLSIVQYLIGQGANATLLNNQKNNALMVFASQNNHAIIDFLFKSGHVDLENINLKNQNGDTALLLAAKAQPKWERETCSANKEMFTNLLKAGANKFDQDAQNNNVIMVLASQGNDAAAEYFVQNISFNINQTNKDQDTAFMLALRSNCKHTARRLLHDTFMAPEHRNIIHSLLQRETMSAHRDTDGNNLLMQYASKAHHKTVAFLLGLRLFHIDSANNAGNTALLLAVEASCLKTIQEIVKQKPNIDYTNKDGHTALMLAKNPKIAQYLIAQGANTTLCNHQNNNALMIFAQKQMADMIDLAGHKVNIHLENHNGDTALFLAVKKNCLKTVKNLFKSSQLNPNYQNKEGYTALMHSTSLDMIEYLFKHKADPTITNNEGNNTLMVFARQNKHALIEWILNQPLQWKAIYARNDNANTALQIAVNAGHTETVSCIFQLLLKHGCTKDDRLNRLNRLNISHAVHSAITGKNTDILMHLIRLSDAIRPSDAITPSKHRTLFDQILTDISGHNNETAILLTARTASLEIMEVLLRFNVDMALNHTNIYGETAVMIASHAGHLQVLEFLFANHSLRQKGILNEEHINKKNMQNNTAFMLAASNGHLDIIQLLLRTYPNKIDVNQRNSKNRTALILAAEKGHLEVVRYLVLTMAAQTEIRDQYGYTALLAAAEHGHGNIVNFLLKNVDRINIDESVYTENEECSKDSVLILLTRNRCLEAIKILLDMRTQITLNYQNKDKDSALICAVSDNSKEIAELLIQKGACIDLKNNLHDNALSVAIYRNNAEIAHTLLDKIESDPAFFCCLDNTNNNHKTPLMLAAGSHIDISVIERMIRMGASRTQMNDKHQIPYDCLNKSRLEHDARLWILHPTAQLPPLMPKSDTDKREFDLHTPHPIVFSRSHQKPDSSEKQTYSPSL